MKDARIFIEHIIESIELIEKYIKNHTKNDFLSSAQLQDSVIRRLEIIGEAVKNIPDNYRKEYPDIKWKEIAGLRDILIRQCFGIDFELTWEIVIRDLPEIKNKIILIKDKLH